MGGVASSTTSSTLGSDVKAYGYRRPRLPWVFPSVALTVAAVTGVAAAIGAGWHRDLRILTLLNSATTFVVIWLSRPRLELSTEVVELSPEKISFRRSDVILYTFPTDQVKVRVEDTSGSDADSYHYRISCGNESFDVRPNLVDLEGFRVYLGELTHDEYPRLIDVIRSRWR